jgi:hypothetical protein
VEQIRSNAAKTNTAMTLELEKMRTNPFSEVENIEEQEVWMMGMGLAL